MTEILTTVAFGLGFAAAFLSVTPRRSLSPASLVGIGLFIATFAAGWLLIRDDSPWFFFALGLGTFVGGLLRYWHSSRRREGAESP